MPAGELRESSAAVYRRFARWWLHDFEAVLTRRLERLDVERAVWGWKVSKRSRAHAVKVFRLAWNWGVKRGHCEPLDLRRLVAAPKPGEYVQNSYTPSPEQVQAVLDQVDGDVGIVLELLALTGARVGEAVTFDGDVVEFDGKTGRRRVPLPASAGHLLEAWPTERVSDNRIRRALNSGCDRAGVPRFTPHGIRRMVVMRMLAVGVDVKTISMITGHSVTVLLRDYVRPQESDLRAALARSTMRVLELRRGEG